MKPRSTLKSYFTKGAIPKESDFADLIDSMLIQDEDTVFKTANDPLSIKATGAEEALLNFYRAEQGTNTLTWQLKQKPAGSGKPGLSIGDSTGSRLFIESGSGNVGIGTTGSEGRLQIINANQDATGNTLVLGPTSASNLRLGYNQDYSWVQSHGSKPLAINPIGNNVGIGTTDPKAKLTVSGDLIRKVAIATGLGPGDDTDNGQIKSRVLSFSKQYADTAIRILYCDNFRVYNAGNVGIGTAARWEIRIDGKSVPGGAIYQDKFGLTGNFHEPATILGYAQGVSIGVYEIQIWVGPLGTYPVEAYTGWLDSRWTIEAQEVWV